MNSLSFSVVITTKDRQFYLERALSSILESSILPSDIIVINDGGSVPSFTNPRGDVVITYVNHHRSFGANFCRNKGICLAQNDHVFLLDDDDYLEQDSFKSRLSVIESKTDYGLVFTGISVVLSDNLEKIVRTVKPKGSNQYYKDLLSKGNIIGSTSRVLINRNAFKDVGMFDENLKSLQDYELWLRIASRYAVYHDNKCGVRYTIHKGSSQISSAYDKYISSAEYIKEKYRNIGFYYHRRLVSSLYLRVAISAAHSSPEKKLRYIFKSLANFPSMKAFALLFPYRILQMARPFI